MDYQEWWENTWKERENLFKKEFEDTLPPDTVMGFEWDDFDLMVPGGCAMVFPPRPPRRTHWLTISHGLSQPPEPSAAHTGEIASGCGYEFGFLTESKESWCPDALWYLMTYLNQSKTVIARGHRVPMWFSMKDEQHYNPVVGNPQPDDETYAFGEMRALLFWPYMAHPAGFSTSTGYFSVLVGTTITQNEWDLAKATSAAHLLLLLFEAGIGQTSDINRATVVLDKTWQNRWREIRVLSKSTVEQMLLDFNLII